MRVTRRQDILLDLRSPNAIGWQRGTDRRWEKGEEISLLESKVTEYRPNETARLVTDHELQHEIRKASIRALAKEAGVSENTVKAARRGERLQKAMIAKLREALGTNPLQTNS